MNLNNEINFDLCLKQAYNDIQKNIISDVRLNDIETLVTASEMLNLPLEQCALMTVIYCKGETQQVYQKDLFNMFHKFFNHRQREIRICLNRLIREEFIQKLDDGVNCHFQLNNNTLRAIDENNSEFFKFSSPEGLEAVLTLFSKKALDYDRLREPDLNELYYKLYEKNDHLNIFKFCCNLFLYSTHISEIVILAICSRAFIDNESFNFDYIERYYTFNKTDIQDLRKSILKGTWEPIEKGYIEIDGGSHLEFNPKLQLTNSGLDYLLAEIDPFTLNFIRKKMGAIKTPLIHPSEIQKIKLHFNPEFQYTSNRIISLLSFDKFKKYQSSLNSNERMKGVTFLFHGEPGCGKTEYALQIARLTKRPLMKIQVSDILSKWVGDSEINLKRIFSDYKKLYEKSDEAPILFLNECDQIIGKRVDTQNSVDQMSNGLQNIVLEEMETFPGILIGTTNLVNNMDPAFERRWTVKLKFEAPTTQAMIMIWKNAIKGISTEDAKSLSLEFKFTPGEIMNISRRFAFEKLLGTKKKRIDLLRDLCKTEKYQLIQNAKIIGFEFQNELQKSG